MDARALPFAKPSKEGGDDAQENIADQGRPALDRASATATATATFGRTGVEGVDEQTQGE